MLAQIKRTCIVLGMNSPKSLPTVQVALSALLAALGFESLSRGVLTETSPRRLSWYALFVLRHSPATISDKLAVNFRALGLIA